MSLSRDLASAIVQGQRKTSRVTCVVEGCDEQIPDTEKRISEHFLERHSDYLASRTLAEVIKHVRRRNDNLKPLNTAEIKPEQEIGQPDAGVVEPSTTPGNPSERLGDAGEPHRRSRTRGTGLASSPHDFKPRPAPIGGKLWNPGDASPSTPAARLKGGAGRPPRFDNTGRNRSLPLADDEPAPDEETQLMRQPETRAISQEQLVAEVKGIYAGLVMVESKCIEVDNAQSSQSDAKLNHEQWQALIALHRTLLHEHHDFFLASQHPSASPPLRRLASKYAMPARMWRHGIHSFLELLRHRLPGSLEHMLTFIYLAYSMMALLYETVPAFEETWIECLGDLGRYRMAIEDDDIRDREVWTSVSRHWYSKASDKAPTTGRLYHHLAILARPNALQQLFYYAKSLCVPIPFLSARESIMTLFDPILSQSSSQHSRIPPIDTAFVKAHAILFAEKHVEEFEPAMNEFLSNLDNHIARTTRRWSEAGYYVAVANCCALLCFGKDNVILSKIRLQQRSEDSDDVKDLEPDDAFYRALSLANGTHEVAFRRFADPNVLPYTHIILVFMHHLTFYPAAMSYVQPTFPWKVLSLLLNSLLLSYRDYPRIESDAFPRKDKELPRPLPEDFALKGLLFVDRYFPVDWFKNDKIDDEEKYLEVASMTDERKERVLWLGRMIASKGHGLEYDEVVHQFRVTAEHDKEIEVFAKGVDMVNISESDSVSHTSTFDSATATGNSVTWVPEKDEEMLDVDDFSASIANKPVIRQ